MKYKQNQVWVAKVWSKPRVVKILSTEPYQYSKDRAPCRLTDRCFDINRGWAIERGGSGLLCAAVQSDLGSFADLGRDLSNDQEFKKSLGHLFSTSEVYPCVLYRNAFIRLIGDLSC